MFKKKHKILGGSSHVRKRLGVGRSKRSRVWKRPTRYMGRRLSPGESIHDVYHREIARYKGLPEEFQRVFERRVK